jgi:hypothetical protein
MKLVRGANVKAVQRMLGHASAAMTLDTYADLFDDDLDYVAQALSRARDTQRTITVPEGPYSGPAGYRGPLQATDDLTAESYAFSGSATCSRFTRPM